MAERVANEPMCHCGHAMYSHYMCGAPDETRCYGRAQCGCQQFGDKQFVSTERYRAMQERQKERDAQPAGRRTLRRLPTSAARKR